MIRFRVLLVGWLLLGAGLAYPRDPDAGLPDIQGSPSVPAANPPPAAVDNRVLELQTAGYYELAARAQELGLSTAGGVPDLRKRIAEKLGLTLGPEPSPSHKTLTIDSAQKAGLVTVDAPGDGHLLRLSGGLQVTLVDQEKKVTHVIVADELWYDQANEEMTARGNVVYSMIRESSTDVFRGDSMTFRLSDSQGIFYGGASDRKRTVGDQTMTFRYAGDAIRRSGEDLVVMDSGIITSSLGKDPNYRILAKRIWVLAPGEWGLQDSVLYMGRIPVMYFPFFFQPGDEFFFNPVLSFPGAGDRRGTSLQTTTYVWGKKKKDAQPMSFLQMEDSKAQETDPVIKGLYLVRGTPPPSNVPPNWTLKVLADFYSNLGFLTGLDASLPGLAGLQTFTASGGFGVTRTVSSLGLPFSINPFQAELDPWDQSQWNVSYLGSNRLPFRWGGQTALTAGWGNFSAEYYSDPLLYNDMTGNRSENFSVFSLLGLGPAVATNTSTAKSSLVWTGTANLPPASTTGSLLWNARTRQPQGIDGDPLNSFYTPSQLVFPQVTLNFQGTLWPPAADSDAQKKSFSLLIPPQTNAPEPKDEPQTPSFSPAVIPPALLDSLPDAAAPGQWVSGVTWSFQPTTKVDTRYYDEDPPRGPRGPQDDLWKTKTSRWTGSYDSKITFTSGLSDNLWVNSNSFSLHQQTQDTYYIDSLESGNTSTYRDQDKQQTSSLLSQNLTSTLKPWVSGGPWRDSSVQYNLATSLWQAQGDKNVYYNGQKETVTSHQTSTQGVWYLREDYPTVKAQAGWQTNLPPLDKLRTYTGRLDAAIPWAKAYTTITAQETEKLWIFSPWESSVEWDPVKEALLNETYRYDVDKKRPVSSVTDLQAWGFEAKYTHQRTTAYTFDKVSRQWRAGAEDYLPSQLFFGYTLDIPLVQWWHWRNSLSARVNASWPINLQQYSDMPFTLNYALIYKLARFIDIQVQQGVVNRAAFRYFPFLVESFGDGVVSTVNPAKDILDSLSIWDTAALRRSNFKMSNLTIAAVHYLDDWQIKLSYTGSPQLVTTGSISQYQWQGTLNLLVQWLPIPELKTRLQVDQNGTLTNPKDTAATSTQTTTSTALPTTTP